MMECQNAGTPEYLNMERRDTLKTRNAGMRNNILKLINNSSSDKPIRSHGCTLIPR